jgi:hypothetical protein
MSIWYVLGIGATGWLLSGVLGWFWSTAAATLLSFALMYWRLVVKGEGAPQEKPGLYAVSLRLDAPALARLNDLCDAMELSREEVVAKALAALPLEEQESGLA